MALWSSGTVLGTNAANGVFSVGEGKRIQFASALETSLVQWSTANDWSEEHKAEEGHEGWYVLSSDEWTYLLITRDGEGVRKNSLATVAGDSGMIILPDEWVQPIGAPAYNPLYMDAGYEANVYDASTWSLMAASGAVFLPCRGYSSDGVDVIDAKDHGAYWSSDPFSADNGCCIHFNPGEIHDYNTFASKALYYSIVLVKTVSSMPELYEEHEAAAFAADLAAARGKNYAIVNRTLRKDSTLYTLCLPFDVPNIDASPLSGAEIFEFEGGHVSGEAGAERIYLNMSRLQGKRLLRGVPYILRWSKTRPVETISRLCFYEVENWDEDTEPSTDTGDDQIKLRGLYAKTHIDGYDSREEPQAHRIFFIGADNTLYWPDDFTYRESKMKGFRAYFYLPTAGDPSPVSRYRNMPAVWNIYGMPEQTTGIEKGSGRSVESKKLLLDGQIVVVIDGVKYDIQGRKI